MKAAKKGTGAARFLLAGLVATCLGLGGGALSATEPIDWDLAVDVTPLNPTTEDTIRLLMSANVVNNCTVLSFSQPPQVEGSHIRLQGQRGDQSTTCTGGRLYYDPIVLPRLSTQGTYLLEIMDEDLLLFSRPLEVRGPRKQLNFPYGFFVTLRLTDPRVGPPRDASAVQLTEEAGYFWCFTPENIEVTVKVLDGRPVNGHFWIFLSGMTNLGLTVTVTEFSCVPPACRTKTYTNPPGKRLNIIDTNLF